MILDCPSCRARYLVQIGLFAQGGRTVRCARCKHSWHATLPSHIEVFAPLPPFAPAAAPPGGMPPAGAAGIAGRTTSPPSAMPGAIPPSSPLADAVIANLPAVIRNWDWRRRFYPALGIALAVIALLSWPILDRNHIVKVMPGLRGAYEMLGLPIDHSSDGLIFDRVKSELRYDGGTMKLYVDGIIENTTPEAQFVPPIMARALGPDRAIIQSWSVDAPAATVAAGSEIPFHTEINAPMKRTIEDVYLEFYAEGEKADVAK